MPWIDVWERLCFIGFGYIHINIEPPTHTHTRGVLIIIIKMFREQGNEISSSDLPVLRIFSTPPNLKNDDEHK